ncbi:hypothetical protein VD0002_g7803 [Verticillium dahliae]|uniref:Peptidase S8/S53 domain-containing protein n=1 Tax=Verticillium dahliae TaxID=27337 RepID=A0AA44WBR4_VERDA|nr:hypothetical protein BJF96_g7989 [Verticillium dahliae]PNH45890.1 hypothetical protein VD0004_g2127 [Verticillium dahliae]PNH59766.1 hypothetical protein VD0002_g7803 [Verticillium dahliae]PNH75113.1 hypothetical protein VD0001_g2445 [Verticillium dahliae]
MQPVHLLLGLVLSSTAGLGQQTDGGLGTRPGSLETNRYIVEFAKESDFDYVKTSIESRIGNKIVKSFKGDIFKGISIETSVENAESLHMIRNVANVWRSKTVQLDPAIDKQDQPDDAGASNYTIHHMTGVDRLHAEGIRGRGVTVAIIDTGIQYTHPALGGGMGPKYKVIGGYDFVGDRWYPRGTFEKEPDDDPFDIDGHGTHVAGIIAGLTEKAHEDGADIITASIGGPGGWSSSAWSTVASRIVDAGTIVTISAGNSGELGPFFGSSGSSGKFVLAVASVEADTYPAIPFEATYIRPGSNDSNTTTFAYLPDYEPFPPSVRDLPMFALSLNASDVLAGCESLPANTRNLSNYVVLLPLLPLGVNTNCSSYAKQRNVAHFGARYILFFSPQGASLQQPETGSDLIGVGVLDYKTAELFLTVHINGNQVLLNFSVESGTNYVGISNAGGGFASYFTSQAALYNLEIKPDVAAPGGNIFSSYLDNTYTVLSGTSMACPYVAGVAALYISQHGGKGIHGIRFAKDLAMRIMSSGRAVRWHDGQSDKDYGFWAPVTQVGTGIVDAYKVVHYETSLSWSKFALNDTQNHRQHQKVAIKNNGTSRVRYRFKVQDSGGHDVLDSGDPPLVQLGPIPHGETSFLPFKMTPDVLLPSDEFWVNPGSTKNAEFVFDYPAGFDDDKLSVYSGKILIHGTNAEELSVPYMGVAGSIRTTFARVFYPNYPRSSSTANDIPIEEKPTYTFDLSLEAQDFPRIVCGFRWGVRHLRWDIFEAGWEDSRWYYPPEAGKNGYVGAATSWAGAEYAYVFNASKDDEMDLVAFPVFDLARDIPYEYWWLGRLANGQLIEPGNYTFRFAALTPFGSPENAHDWDVFDVPEIQVISQASQGAV